VGAALLAAFYEGLASFSRLILFDKRGTGLSDRAAGLPTIEQRMDDVRAVMDAAGSSRAADLRHVRRGGYGHDLRPPFIPITDCP